jgi:hypothetical protein
MFELTSKSYPRTIGFIYLLIAISGGFSIAYVPSQIIGDTPTETIELLSANQTLFRLGVFGDILMAMLELAATAMLYWLFRKVNRTLSLAAAFARIGMAFIMGINLMIYLSPQYLIQAGYMQDETLEAMVDLLFQVHADGILVWGLFFGVHIVLLGVLILGSGFVPKIIGWLMLPGGIGYILEALGAFVLPPSPVIEYLSIALLAVVTIAELSFTFYLLIKRTPNRVVD